MVFDHRLNDGDVVNVAAYISANEPK